jgi:hypothetical protein
MFVSLDKLADEKRGACHTVAFAEAEFSPNQRTFISRRHDQRFDDPNRDPVAHHRRTAAL